jgi:hypothetical protein
MLDEITSLTGMAAQPVLVGDRDLDDVMTRHFGSAASAVAAVKVS